MWCRCSSGEEQALLVEQLWTLWSDMPRYGRKSAQFVDLLGYFSLKTQPADATVAQYVEKAVSVLRGQNKVLAHHPNGSLYK